MSNEAGGKSYGQGVTPWHLCESMESSGIAHVDALRCDVIEYAFRKKGDLAKMADDLDKAAHCASKAAAFVRSRIENETIDKMLDVAPVVCNCDSCRMQNASNSLADAWRRSPDCIFPRMIVE